MRRIVRSRRFFLGALARLGGLALSTPITLFAVPTLLVAIRGRDYVIPPLRLEHQ